MSKKVLGRGIDALFSEQHTAAAAKIAEDGTVAVNGINDFSEGVFTEGSLFKSLPLTDIAPNVKQPRRHFDQQELEQLAASIKEQGVLQPVLVEKQNDRYLLIAGERRYRAAKMAGLEQIPAIIKNGLSQEELLEIAITENIQRQDLNPIEEATAYRQLIEVYGLSQEMVARKMAKSRSVIANALRLLKLEPEIQQALCDGRISQSHARTLLSIEDRRQRDELFAGIIAGGVSVRQVEEKSRGKKSGNGKKNSQKGMGFGASAELAALEDRLITKFGSKTAIKGGDQGGVIEISYYSIADLQRIIDIIEDEGVRKTL